MIEAYRRVPEDGFEWVNTTGYPDGNIGGSGIKGVYLAERTKAGQLAGYRTYPAHKETGLFKVFAATEPTREGVLRFANSYGHLLRAADSITIGQPVANPPGTFFPVVAETLEAWQREIFAMRHAVELWERARAVDVAWLQEFVRWHVPANKTAPDREVIYIGPKGPGDKFPPQFVIASESSSPDRLALFRDGDTAGPALHAVQRLVNTKLKEHVATPRLFWDRTSRGATLRVLIAPESLISALWVQLAYGIEGNREYRSCDQCQKWVEVAAERREDARFCSAACRFKAYRGRQKQAQRLHTEGMSFKEIAEKLGSDTQTVKGWVKK